LTSVLADAFPDDVTFCRDSLNVVARQTTFLWEGSDQES
jgi:hypothetical protein